MSCSKCISWNLGIDGYFLAMAGEDLFARFEVALNRSAEIGMDLWEGSIRLWGIERVCIADGTIVMRGVEIFLLRQGSLIFL